MNPLLLIGGTSLVAYLLLRHRDAMAAVSSSAQPAPGASPMPAVLPPTWAPAEPARPIMMLPAPTSPPIIVSGGESTSPRTPSLPPLIVPQITKPAPPFVGELPRPSLQLSGRWGWPVPRWQGRAPVISDGYGSPRPGMKHAGVDLMFARVTSDPYPKTGPNGSRGYVMPDSWPAVAASDGVLWSAQRTARGYAVVIDHGTVATFYQHLERLFVPETAPPPKGTPRQQRIPIRAAQPLGIIGGDPINPPHLKHLHFELWPSGPQSAIDPAGLMRTWQVFTPADLAQFMTVRNAVKDGLVHVKQYTRKPMVRAHTRRPPPILLGSEP